MGTCECGCGSEARTGRRFLHGHNTSPHGFRDYTVDESTGCWNWNKSTNGVGYGRARIAGESRIRYAHHVYFERFVGPIIDGFDIHHTCRNRACVNPDHLVLVGKSEHRSDHSRERVYKPRQRFYCPECGVEVGTRGSRCRPHAAAHWQRERRAAS